MRGYKSRNLQVPQRLLSPRVHGKNPRGTAAMAGHGSSWKLLPGGGEANHVTAKEVNCSQSERQKSQEELHHGAWDRSKYLTDFNIMKIFFPPFLQGGGVFCFSARRRPVTHPSGPLSAPVSLFEPREFKAGPLGAAQCALTPCNEISGCCWTGFNQRVRAKTYRLLLMNHLFHQLMADGRGHCCCCHRPITQPGSPTESGIAFWKKDLAECAATATHKNTLQSEVLQSKGQFYPNCEGKSFVTFVDVWPRWCKPSLWLKFGGQLLHFLTTQQCNWLHFSPLKLWF